MSIVTDKDRLTSKLIRALQENEDLTGFQKNIHKGLITRMALHFDGNLRSEKIVGAMVSKF